MIVYKIFKQRGGVTTNLNEIFYYEKVPFQRRASFIFCYPETRTFRKRNGIKNPK